MSSVFQQLDVNSLSLLVINTIGILQQRTSLSSTRQPNCLALINSLQGIKCKYFVSRSTITSIKSCQTPRTGSIDFGSLTIKSIVTSSYSYLGGSLNSRLLYLACRNALFLLQLLHRLTYSKTFCFMFRNTKLRWICSIV